MNTSDTSLQLESQPPLTSPSTWGRDLISGGVVFLVALPLCLGIALASGAPLFSGLVAGIVGGIVVGLISGSHTSVTGPAAGLTAIVAAQIALLGSFEAFLFAVVLGGLIQIGFGIARGGALSAFFPSSVVKGLLAAIGVILILKQIPHLLGHDTDPEGEMSFSQPDDENTFSELMTLLYGEIHIGAVVIGLLSIAVLVLWNKVDLLRKSVVPGPLIVVLLGVGLTLLFRTFDGRWLLEGNHLVQVPVAESVSQFWGFLRFPDVSVWNNPDVYLAGVTIAIVASLETLLNLEAVDKLDTRQRNSPASRELVAQGVGNTVSGLIGGLPVTSVIVRGSVNVSAGSKSKLSAIFHGIYLLVCVAMFPMYLNLIPLSALAAILLVTGFKLASPALFKQMWQEGRYQFIPFIVTLLSIVFTDLLIGILIGLAVSVLFILNSNLRRPIRRIVETHIDGDVTHIELANQVSFLNRAALDKVFNSMPHGSSVLMDATESDYIDPDVLSLIRDFKHKVAPARNIRVSLRGFRKKYQLHDDIQFADYTTRELQDKVSPEQVLEILREGNRRFVSGNRLSRDFGRQVHATADGQNPLAVVLSCIDSRVPAELVLDVGLGDIFSVRVAGNVVGTKSLGSIEYGVGVAGAKLVVVLGHTRCGAVTSSVQLVSQKRNAESETGCQHLQAIVEEIAPSVSAIANGSIAQLTEDEQERVVDEVARRNVEHTVRAILKRSDVIRSAVDAGRAQVVGALYDVKSGRIEFFDGVQA
ncbi:bifunctional SulP family inorganic anion transporter/carbonic anhydrase [Roseimaritima ulvae]|uniref:Carbonic anhydrase n=1 Tax=Roseimaritima ulvae TaxID=980254 RepID=A0A5B9R2Y0_9BACT|nr:SulP family inorganic anion transporter [Roseimaritima ulvae]QEG40631.1 Carbonic anhydrase [Roseimaritima ulvae]